MIEKVKAVFEYDGYHAIAGKIKINVSSASVDENPIPTKYAILMLHEETREEAWRLYKTVVGFTSREDVRKHLFTTAYEKGFNEAWRLVDVFKAEKPNGKPRFYAATNWRFEPQQRTLVLTNGEEGFTLPTGFGVELLGLPLNVYVSPAYTGFALTRQKYVEAESRLEEFFNFVKRLVNAENHVSAKRMDKAFQAFFTDRAEAYRMLEGIEADADHRQRRDSLFERLKRENVLRFSKGYMVYGWGVYYVSEEGAVYKLKYSKDVDLREALLRAVERGKLPRKMVEVEDRQELRRAVEALGRVKPELALVIAP
jgi:hypothetical protein